jgi:hypothetical protein
VGCAKTLGEKGVPKFVATGERDAEDGKPLALSRVYINKTQYFEGCGEKCCSSKSAHSVGTLTLFSDERVGGLENDFE